MKTTRRGLFGLLIGAAVCPRELLKKEPEFEWKRIAVGDIDPDAPIVFKGKITVPAHGWQQEALVASGWRPRA
jgi:hypothetical protein